MIKSREIALEHSCLNKAADDEPVFVLRSTDKLAPILVRVWADLAKAHGCGHHKIREAKQLAHDMEQYAEQRGIGKFPD